MIGHSCAKMHRQISCAKDCSSCEAFKHLNGCHRVVSNLLQHGIQQESKGVAIKTEMQECVHDKMIQTPILNTKLAK